MASEKRAAPRLEAILNIDYSIDADNVFLFYVSSDISKAGIFISTNEPLPVGAPIDVIISVPHENPEMAAHRVVIRGEVKQSTRKAGGAKKGPGMGVRFLDLSDGDWRLIEKAVKSGTGGPMELGVVTGDASEAIKQQIEMIRRHSKELKKEAEALAKDMDLEDD